MEIIGILAIFWKDFRSVIGDGKWGGRIGILYGWVFEGSEMGW